MKADIESLTADDARAHAAELGALLEDVVDGGASIGSLSPLAPSEARDYWQTVVRALAEGSRALLVAREADGAILGTVQLDLVMRPNGRHRGEVAKLMVHRRARRRGIGRALMLAVDEHARRLGRTTLFLDTRLGDPAERLYRSVGWTFRGTIPRCARSTNGALDANAIYYKLLDRG